MSRIKIVFGLAIVLVLAGCAANNTNTNKDLGATQRKETTSIAGYQPKQSTSTPTPTAAPNPPDDGASEFSAAVKNEYITLGRYEEPDRIEQLLGKPLSETIEVLGQGADTFMGSTIRRNSYKGIDITFMSPRGDGKKFWVLEMKTTDPQIATKRGIKVGDALNKLLELYPDMEMAKDGRTDKNNCAYEYCNRENYEFLRFEVKNGVVSEIKLYKELP